MSLASQITALASRVAAEMKLKAPIANPTFTGVVGATMGAGSVGTGTFRDDVDARIDAMTKNMEAGAASVTITAINTDYSTTVTFSPAFAARPRVTAIPNNLSNPASARWSLNNVSATGFNIVCNRSSGTAAVTFDWIAVTDG
jgi:hypothetical protein